MILLSRFINFYTLRSSRRIKTVLLLFPCLFMFRNFVALFILIYHKFLKILFCNILYLIALRISSNIASLSLQYTIALAVLFVKWKIILSYEYA